MDGRTYFPARLSEMDETDLTKVSDVKRYSAILIHSFFVQAVQGERHDVQDSDLAENLVVTVGYHSLNWPDGCTVIQLKCGIEFFGDSEI